MPLYWIEILIKSDSNAYWPSINVLKKCDLFAIFKYLRLLSKRVLNLMRAVYCALGN